MHEIYQHLQRAYTAKLNQLKTTHKRYLYNNINWSSRLICIRGARGTGKTTMLLQYIKENYADKSKALYISLDDFHFQTVTLYDVAEYAYQHGVEAVFIDEVHYHHLWAQMIKNLYDTYADLKIVYTGSSMLQLDNAQADLSRRQTIYELYGFSFREYLQFKDIFDIQPFNLETLLNNHTDISMQVNQNCRPLALFDEYLKTGYYPFTMEAKTDYYGRLQQVMQLSIDQDIPLVEDISFMTLKKIKKLLIIIASQVPLEPNISTLCREVDSTRNVVVKLLSLLDRAGILALLSKETHSYRALSRPDKIFLNNTNQMFALTENVNRGTLRETFFLNQLQAYHAVLMPPQGDFLVDDKYLYEVGGADKTFKQIKDIPDSYLAVDDTEIGIGNRIPLWLFGFLY